MVSKLLVRGGTDQDRQLGAITAELGRLAPEQVVKFKIWLDDQMQRANRWDLWCAAYVMCGGCGDDGFEYFRAWLIGQGEEVFEHAIEDPETLADLPMVDPMMECEFESLIYVATDVYEGGSMVVHIEDARTGEDVWVAWGQANVEPAFIGPENMRRWVYNLVGSMFDDWPVPPRS